MTSLKMIANHKSGKHDIEGALTFKFENIKEKASEYEMRDSSGYSIPHNPQRLDLIYTHTSSLPTRKSTCCRICSSSWNRLPAPARNS